MRERTCLFTGHRDIPEQDFAEIKKRTRAAIISLIEKGIIYYGAGGARGFDTIAAETVLELKKDYPQIKLILVLPCRDQTKGWLEADIRKYNAIWEKADKVVYISEHYFRGCMHVRNRHLVDHSKYCICYLTKDTGGTAFTVNYYVSLHYLLKHMAHLVQAVVWTAGLDDRLADSGLIPF